MTIHDVADQLAETIRRPAVIDDLRYQPLVSSRPLGLLREETMSALLHPQPGERRQAFADAVAKRWILRGAQTAVWAVTLDADISDLEQHAMGRRLGGSRATSMDFLQARDGLLLFLGSRAHAHSDDDAIRQDAQQRGLQIQSIGTAQVNSRHDDLLPAVERAMTAARITAIVPQLPNTADITQLGPWAMLSMISCDRSYLEIFSPAAHALSGPDDEERRRTVEVYLDSGCHPSVASRILHIHRTTLYYRIERMPDVVREALDDGVARSALHLCLKLIRLWDSAG
ncbi:PucR family transcriptional regulator [Rathayibacter sp. VKM Ac-2801]|uniref:helix-turn-helix domain-containing protein n=1 Tax=Rathayibacter sp. VKM Ac-2801 TaxID=2609255 RepID=UPI00131F9C6C|nr:PucR family transcriptional regulator [Rathayibacter sp. VKM Ac-2801]QHC71743.1 hypothetical protein GSU45_16025 [Rathayibacter sp. VKM Ac-2801]